MTEHPIDNTISKGIGNYKTTIVGALTGIGYYGQMNGLNIPHDGPGWLAFGISVLIAILGLLSKDATTGSPPK